MTSADERKYQEALRVLDSLLDLMGEDSSYGETWVHTASLVIADCRDYLDAEEE